jgi:hypothetical protein
VKLYEDNEELKLTASAGLTKEVHELVEREKKRLLEKEGRKLSRAKIVNNALIKMLSTSFRG